MSSSIIVFSGDSGHGFKMFPIAGPFITDLLEAADGKQPVVRWRLKNPNPTSGKGDWGGDVSWRLGESKELSAIMLPNASIL